MKQVDLTPKQMELAKAMANEAIASGEFNFVFSDTFIPHLTFFGSTMKIWASAPDFQALIREQLVEPVNRRGHSSLRQSALAIIQNDFRRHDIGVPMEELDLFETQRKIALEMIEEFGRTNRPDFTYFSADPTHVVMSGSDRRIYSSFDDLREIERAGIITLEDANSKGCGGKLRASGIALVRNEFKRPAGAAQQNNIVNFYGSGNVSNIAGRDSIVQEQVLADQGELSALMSSLRVGIEKLTPSDKQDASAIHQLLGEELSKEKPHFAKLKSFVSGLAEYGPKVVEIGTAIAGLSQLIEKFRLHV